MVLNIFPRKKETEAAPSPAETATLPEPSSEALAEAESSPRRGTRRGSRGGQARKRTTASTTDAELTAAAAANQPAVEEPAPLPVRQPRAAATGEKAAPRRARSRAPEQTEPGEPEAPQPAKTDDPGSRRRGTRAPQPAEDGKGDLATLAHAIEQQSRQIEHLARAQEELARRMGGGTHPIAPPARVGIFVDAANIELACDRLRPSIRLNWKKVFDMLSRDRQVVRAIAYCPIHDDPDVSIETQRFVEPFLDKGFKIFTKPLKRFQDNTIKANVDIELALDIVEMLDRLDIVCLGSGDGDFQRLVELVQSRGVRVEVIGIGSSTATNLRNAADEYIDLATRIKELRA